MATGFAEHEASQHSAQPIQLFKFIYGQGADEYYGYTDHTEQVTLPDGTVYEPVPIDRGKITSNGTLDRSALKINTDLGTALAELFRVYPPPEVVSCIIRQGHVDDPDEEFLVVWAGRVVSAFREHGELVMSGEPVSTSLRRPGLRRHYQYGCPHVLYGPHCKADKASKTLPATIDSITGATITLDAGWNGAFAAAKFLGGMIEWPTAGGSIDRRTILRITGDTLSLSGIPSGLAPGDSIDVVLGCNHQAFESLGGDCEGLHDNLPHYGGQPWIPTKNTVGTYNHYY